MMLSTMLPPAIHCLLSSELERRGRREANRASSLLELKRPENEERRVFIMCYG